MLRLSPNPESGNWGLGGGLVHHCPSPTQQVTLSAHPLANNHSCRLRTSILARRLHGPQLGSRGAAFHVHAVNRTRRLNFCSNVPKATQSIPSLNPWPITKLRMQHPMPQGGGVWPGAAGVPVGQAARTELPAEDAGDWEPRPAVEDDWEPVAAPSDAGKGHCHGFPRCQSC